MRLYLSSERLGERAGALLAMLQGPRVAVIANGYDGTGTMNATMDGPGIYDPAEEFKNLGLEPAYLDLRAYFGDPKSLRQRLEFYHLVWVMGGNSFVLRRAMKWSGFDSVIHELLPGDAMTYGGYGAGAAVAGPSLHGLELMDDPWELPEGYPDQLIWSGLGLTPFTIVPHFRSPTRNWPRPKRSCPT